MKRKDARKLDLKTETLIALQPDQLALVDGGAAAAQGRSKSWFPLSCVSADGGNSCSICPR
jgi:hypothetical protein